MVAQMPAASSPPRFKDTQNTFRRNLSEVAEVEDIVVFFCRISPIPFPIYLKLAACEQADSNDMHTSPMESEENLNGGMRNSLGFSPPRP